MSGRVSAGSTAAAVDGVDGFSEKVGLPARCKAVTRHCCSRTPGPPAMVGAAEGRLRRTLGHLRPAAAAAAATSPFADEVFAEEATERPPGATATVLHYSAQPAPDAPHMAPGARHCMCTVAPPPAVTCALCRVAAVLAAPLDPLAASQLALVLAWTPLLEPSPRPRSVR
eukprot:COSAG04_NODE_1719_length_5811_cov_5.217962_1_plen_170_part_00